MQMTELTLTAASTGPRPRSLAIIATYVLVAVGLTYPLIFHVGTAIPSERGPMDVFGFIWNNWWVQHALVSLHRPDITNAVFAPFPVDLRLHTLGLLYGILWTPVFPILGPVGVFNTQAILTPVLNGCAGYCLGSYVARDRLAGAIAGLLIAATPAINFHVLSGRPSCAAAWPLLLAMYFLLRLIDRPSYGLAGALATSVIALFLSDQQMTMFGLIWLGVLCCTAAARGRLTKRSVGTLLVVGAAVAIPFVWMYISSIAATREYTIPAAFEAQTYSYPIALLWSPAMIWRAYGLVLPAVLVVAGWQVRRHRELLVWVGAAVAFVVLTFGPVEPRSGVPLPFAALRELPGMGQFRTPYRFQLPAAIGLAIAAAATIGRMPSARQRVAVAVLVAVTAGDVLAQRVVRGFPLSTMPDEPVYTAIARDPRDVVVLEVPFGVRTGTDRIGPGEEFNFYQPIHRKRMINGMLARAPLAALAFYRASPAFMFLAEEATPSRAVVVEDLRRQLRDLRIGYVVMHADRVDERWRALFIEALASVPELERFESGRIETISYRVK
jgi:hypothetical protein